LSAFCLALSAFCLALSASLRAFRRLTALIITGVSQWV
jgi:hypothetical protein